MDIIDRVDMWRRVRQVKQTAPHSLEQSQDSLILTKPCVNNLSIGPRLPCKTWEARIKAAGYPHSPAHVYESACLTATV